jgi:hypothetical protein
MGVRISDLLTLTMSIRLAGDIPRLHRMPKESTASKSDGEIRGRVFPEVWSPAAAEAARHWTRRDRSSETIATAETVPKINTTSSYSHSQRKPELLGQTVVVIGGGAGIGMETALRARAEGAGAILTARNPERLERAASELGALRTPAFDANDPAPLERVFLDLPVPIDHLMARVADRIAEPGRQE